MPGPLLTGQFWHFAATYVNDSGFRAILSGTSATKLRSGLQPLHGNSMRILIGLCFAFALSAAQSGKNAKRSDPAPKQGIKIPGVQIPFANLKAEVELPLAPQWIVFSDTILIPNKSGRLERLDAKANKLVEPVP